MGLHAHAYISLHSGKLLIPSIDIAIIYDPSKLASLRKIQLALSQRQLGINLFIYTLLQHELICEVCKYWFTQHECKRQ